MGRVALKDRLKDLAKQYSYASGIKDAARLRRQCSGEEWNQVRQEAKKIYLYRKSLPVKVYDSFR